MSESILVEYRSFLFKIFAILNGLSSSSDYKELITVILVNFPNPCPNSKVTPSLIGKLN